MNNDTKKVFNEISDNLQHMYFRWQTYVEIFGTNSYRVELLNKASARFFLVYEIILYENIILSLSKLTDPAKMHGHDIASFPYLINSLKNKGNDDLIEKLEDQVELIKLKCHKIKEMRNKHVAHNEQNFEAFFPTREEINIAFEFAADFMRLIHQYFDNVHFDYEGGNHEGGTALIIYLEKASEYDKLDCKHKKLDWVFHKDLNDKDQPQ